MSTVDTPPSRRPSTLDKVTEPSILVSYLCGYSLRTCAAFMLWIDVILIITFFVMAIIVSSLIHFYIITQHVKNETKYTFSLDGTKLLTIDFHGNISANSSIKFSEIGKRFLQIILSSACVHSFVSVTGLIAVYYDRFELMIPYLVIHLLSVLWIASFVLLDLLFIGFQYIKPVWLILFPAILYFLAKLYKLMVIYSYHHHYSGFAMNQMKTPSNLTTQSPVHLPVASDSESIVFRKNMKSENSSHDRSASSNL